MEIIDSLIIYKMYLQEVLRILKITKVRHEPRFYTTDDIQKIFNMSKGRVQRLFMREDFPSCNYFKPYIVEHNALCEFLKNHKDENDNFKIAYIKLMEVNIEK